MGRGEIVKSLTMSESDMITPKVISKRLEAY